MCKRQLPKVSGPRFIGSPKPWLSVAALAAVMAAAQAMGQNPPRSAGAASNAAAAATALIARQVQTKLAPPHETAAAGKNALNLPKMADPTAAAEPVDGAAVEAKKAGPPLTGVAAQCADLLKMATTLQAEVAKTTRDQLSVPVVRKADEIQKLAHKMREHH